MKKLIFIILLTFSFGLYSCNIKSNNSDDIAFLDDVFSNLCSSAYYNDFIETTIDSEDIIDFKMFFSMKEDFMTQNTHFKWSFEENENIYYMSLMVRKKI